MRRASSGCRPQPPAPRRLRLCPRHDLRGQTCRPAARSPKIRAPQTRPPQMHPKWIGTQTQTAKARNTTAARPSKPRAAPQAQTPPLNVRTNVKTSANAPNAATNNKSPNRNANPGVFIALDLLRHATGFAGVRGIAVPVRYPPQADGG